MHNNTQKKAGRLPSGILIILLNPIGIFCRLCGIELSNLSSCEFYLVFARKRQILRYSRFENSYLQK
jgi:hypothetical protein